MAYTFCNKHVMSELLGYSPHTLKTFRQKGDWIEGVHFIRPNPRVVRYNRELCRDWLVNINDPAKHQKAIEKYLSDFQGK